MMDTQLSSDLERLVELRRQYWKLEDARKSLQADISEAEERQDSPKRPITCLLCPGLTPSRLLEHLQSRRATDACILEWTRRLKILRQECEMKEKTYGVTFLGKRR
ncbi:uncharacterized protein LOC123565715 [Mercenaria mercenaria]|uniref:uncharacterized protein LOC123565715 n=1 Tax=Mercenaria mercenaria TaxID=6596 RepID=UPI00234E57F9|nr:uncharacterized protein LOC123565715 [Mercenaria mercenaria]